MFHWQNKCPPGLGQVSSHKEAQFWRFGGFFCTVYNCDKHQDYKEWLSTKLAILLGARKGPLGKL